MLHPIYLYTFKISRLFLIHISIFQVFMLPLCYQMFVSFVTPKESIQLSTAEKQFLTLWVLIPVFAFEYSKKYFFNSCFFAAIIKRTQLRNVFLLYYSTFINQYFLSSINKCLIYKLNIDYFPIKLIASVHD